MTWRRHLPAVRELRETLKKPAGGRTATERIVRPSCSREELWEPLSEAAHPRSTSRHHERRLSRWPDVARAYCSRANRAWSVHGEMNFRLFSIPRPRDRICLSAHREECRGFRPFPPPKQV